MAAQKSCGLKKEKRGRKNRRGSGLYN